VEAFSGGLPVVLKSRYRPGVFIDHDGSIHIGYESNALDSIFADGKLRKVRVDRGKYAGTPMMISPIEDSDGYAVAAIGVIDSMGSLSLHEFIEISESLRSQVGNDL
jgi:hypothetical protein